MGRIEILLLNAGNGTYSDDERSLIQDEVKETVNKLSQILNIALMVLFIWWNKEAIKPTTVNASCKFSICR